MEETDFYRILELDRTASSSQIRSSYIRLVKKYHPDRNSHTNTTKLFQKIQVAYETLSDVNKKIEYDNLSKSKHGPELKKLFLLYQIAIVQMCERYNLSDKIKNELLALFNPNDYHSELEQGDLISAHKKLVDILQKFILNQIIVNYPCFYSVLHSFSTFLS